MADPTIVPPPNGAESLPPAPEKPRPWSGVRTTSVPEGGWESGFPKVFFSVYERQPPIICKTADEEATIDKTYWMTIPPEPPAPPQ